MTGPGAPYLQTARLALRQVHADDVERFYGLDCEPSVWHYKRDLRLFAVESTTR